MRSDWEIAPARRLRPQPQRARPARGLSGQRQRLADRRLDVQRRRRQHHPLRRALPALPPVGLPRQDARRRRRRLAARLPAPGAVLRRQRAHDGRVGTGRRSGVSAEGGAAAAGGARQARRDAGRGASIGSAGTGGRRTARSPRRSYEGRAAVHQRRHVSARLRAGGQGQHRHHLLAGGAARRA